MSPDILSSGIELASQHDGLLLKGFHWDAENPIAVMSIVHGFGEHCGRYSDMAAHLNAAGIAVIAVDLRGHGRTEGPRGVCRNYSDMSADASSLINEAKRIYPDVPHYLFGHSMGGGLVLHVGLNQNHDLAGYLVSAPLIRPAKPVPAPLKFILKILRRIMPKGTLANTIPGKQVSKVPDEQVKYEADTLNHDRLGFGLLIGMLEAGEEVSTRADDWTKPLRLWHAKGDQLTDFTAVKDFAAKAKNCDFTAFENVEHEVHNDTSRAAVYALMVDFIKTQNARDMTA
ncbi:MAG: lysophospholipase [Hellea sp.]